MVNQSESNPSKIKAAVFDVGGVIINDLDVVYRGYCRVVRKFNKEPMPKKRFDKTFSPDWIRMYRAVGVVETPEQILAEYLQFSTTPDHHIDSVAYPDALSCLTELKKSKKLCLNTGYRTPELEAAFVALNIDGSLFDVIMTEDKAGARKPDPITLKKVADELNLEAKDIAFVGDTITDIECGKNAGCITIAVTWGTNDRKDLETAAPDHIVDSWQELHSLLDIL